MAVGSMGRSSSGVSAMVGSPGPSSAEVSAMVGSMGDSSSEASGIVKSDRVAMLVDGDCVTGVTGGAGIVPVSRTVTDSSGGH